VEKKLKIIISQGESSMKELVLLLIISLILVGCQGIKNVKPTSDTIITAKDADTQAKEAIEAYKKFFDTLGIPYTITRRPDWDKFPGAEYTIAFDTIFPDGKVLQIGTVHNLGQNFAKTFLHLLIHWVDILSSA